MKNIISCIDLGIDYNTICEKVFKNKKHWINRGVFDTFGAVCYIDNPEEYINNKNKSNEILISEFADLYETLCDYFGADLNKDVAYPGFHIFNQWNKDVEAAFHFDIAYKTLPIYKKSFSNHQSFTIAIKKPKVGAGLNVWENININKISKKELNLYSENPLVMGKPSYIEYDLGKMYLHNGETLHQIANTGGFTDEYRITLQGHIIQDGGKKYLYF